MATASPNRPRRIVVKLGTGILTSGAGRLDAPRLAGLCRQIAEVRGGGTEVLVVSSGAVGLGMGALGLPKRPAELSRKQACAAIGQSLLMQTWQAGFAPHGITVAQVLLTYEDIRARGRYLSVKATLEELLRYRAVPVINENDTVSAAEIEAGPSRYFGDNDTLSAMVASLVGADRLAILSTAPGLVDLRGTGRIVPVVERITPEIEAMAGGTTSETSVGGMVSKIAAARIATRAGCGVFIASGAEPDILLRLLAGRGGGTFFVPSGLPLHAKKRWLAYFQRPTGAIRIDARAVAALRDEGRSLLAVGVTGTSGEFAAGEVVDIAGPDGAVIAHGRTERSSAELAELAGRKGIEVVHRDDLALL